MNNDISGPDGVTTHGRWLYAGDGATAGSKYSISTAPTRLRSRPSKVLGKPGGCGTATCDGGLMVIDPANITRPTMVLGAFDPKTNTGVLALSDCGPNGATVGPHDNLLLGCTPANNPANDSTLVINATAKHFSHLNGIVGSDEVWFNKGDGRYYTGSNRNCKAAPPCPPRHSKQRCSA